MTPRACANSLICALTILLSIGSLSATTINSVTLSGTQLTITGNGFSGTPLVVTFNGKSIPIVSSSTSQIIATLNPVPVPGSYRLGVRSGTAGAITSFAVTAATNVVSQVALTGQTNSIPLTTLFTPIANGLFRVSANMLAIGGSCSVPGSIVLNWTDDGGQRVPQSDGGGAYEQDGFVSWTVIARVNAGSALSYSTNAQLGSCSSYELYLTVEQLQ
jgi:hypothetical protein